MAEVIMIQGNQAVQQEKPKLRVCAYARVSSKSDEQQYSFFGQVQHYTKLINENPEWEYVDIYADEGLTGTRKDKRDEFNRMLDDCREGKIDKILTKAVSRFARNISECVEVVKELKELGVTVYFEEQQLDSGRPSDFTAICVYATIAQEESISIAHNLRMGCAARMKLSGYTHHLLVLMYIYPLQSHAVCIPKHIYRFLGLFFCICFRILCILSYVRMNIPVLCCPNSIDFFAY